MKRVSSFAMLVLSVTALGTAVGVARAQTPAQMEYERQQREYWRQQEQQRQDQQRQQQLMQDNARRQQDESSRLNAPTSPGAAPGASANARQGSGGSQAEAQRMSAARAMWEKRPPLAAERNPLLGGRWMRPASTRPNPSDPFGPLLALAKGGLCEVLFGGGFFEFRADRLVGMDAQTAEQELDRVEYRGDAKHVVVLPKTTLKLIEFDLDGPDRISWTGQNCVLVRVAATQTGASKSPQQVASAAPSVPAARGAGASGVLTLSVGEPSPGNPVGGRKLWVLKEDAQVALIKGGMKSTPQASVLQQWMRACTARAPSCEQGFRALKVYSVGMATTGSDGRAQTPPLPAGRYWVLSDAKVDNRRVMWNERVDMKGGDRSVTLDQHNALPVD